MLLAACAAGPAGAGCAPQAAVEAGPWASRWQELDTQGRTLLRESGTLAHVAAELSAPGCSWGPWSLRLAAEDGHRQYDGQTNSGVALTTRSRLQQQGLAAQWLPLGGETWRLGARLRWQRVYRDIASTANASGYPERFDTVQAALVLGLQGQFGQAGSGPVTWHLDLAAGGGPGGRMRAQLPGYDTATLRLGASRLLQAEARLQGPLGAADGAWQWRAGLQASAERAGAGLAQALTRNGVIVGGASQPATRQRSLGLSAGLLHRF